MKKLTLSVLCLSIGFSVSTFATPQQDSIVKPDLDPVILELDKLANDFLTREKLFATTAEIQRSIVMTVDELPKYNDLEMKIRMKRIPTVIQLDYNSNVKAFVDLFVYRRRELMTKMLGSSQIYFPIFEQALDRRKLPNELKYLPIVESALNPSAVSSAGATGLWQLMFSTAKMLGCDANSCIDERRDPIKSTEAATLYLKQLYDMYGDWQLVLAAYNSGPGNVNKAIARAGVKNFWAISPYLPAETRSYVPTYIAVVYAMNYAKDYKLVSSEPKRELYAVDTVMIAAKVTLEHIANTLGIPRAELEFLNPSIKSGFVPLVQKGFPLNLPVNYFVQFESKKEIILNDPTLLAKEQFADAYANPEYVKVEKTITHRVRTNETITTVARRYGVTINEIKSWNRLRSTTLQKGQNLAIRTTTLVRNMNFDRDKPTILPTNNPQTTEASTASNDGDEIQEGDEYYIEKDADGNIIKRLVRPSTPSIKTAVVEVAKPASVVAKPAPVAPQSKVLFYKVQSGDTLWTITKKYNGLTIDKLKADNGLSNKSIIQKGQVLKIKL